jgi:hypothetical protein
MSGTAGARRVVDPMTKAGYELEFEDTFDGEDLDRSRWLPYYLPQWSSREAAAARYRLGGGVLRLVVEADQPPWCPEFDGQTRVSSLQTGVFAGPLGSQVGQSRFKPGLVVRQEQDDVRLYTPRYGLFEPRAKALDDPACMVAIDARQFHVYAAEWTPEYVAFFVDHRLVKLVEQSPAYPMQLMLGVYEFPDQAQPSGPARPYPKELVVDFLRGYRPAARR